MRFTLVQMVNKKQEQETRQLVWSIVLSSATHQNIAYLSVGGS